MIRSIHANNPSFKPIEFHEGFNVILADRLHNENADDQKNTRNGAGKTTLIEIIHFCLGADVVKDSIFYNEHLKGWIFTLTLDIYGEVISLERAVDNRNRIYLNGKSSLFSEENLKYDESARRYYFTLTGIRAELLAAIFGIKVDDSVKMPSFRQLISFCIRRNIEGYADPFQAFKSPQAFPRQLCNAYFLGLDTAIAQKFQEVKDKEKAIKNYKKAVDSDLLRELSLNIGQLQTDVITYRRKVQNLEKQLSSFNVHPQYDELRNEVDAITSQLHQLNNTLITKQELLVKYEKAIADESAEISTDEVEEVYKEAGIIFSDNLKRSLEETVRFHKTLILNRKSYLSVEISRLQRELDDIRTQISNFSTERAEKMRFLNSHGALEEYQIMQEILSNERQMLESKEKQLEIAKEVGASKSRLKIEKEELLISARRDLSERIKLIEEAISLFQENTAFLYQEHGTLTIDCDETGYLFRVDIKSSKSQGVGYMKIFCYDMVIAELRRLNNNPFADFWIHDSTIFDGVDERQIARSLMLAHKKTQDIGLQYICMLNSDQIPTNEFDDEFVETFDNSVVLRLDDNTDQGGLLGIRF